MRGWQDGPMRWTRSTTTSRVRAPRTAVAGVVAALVLTGCPATSQPDPLPSIPADSAARAAAELAAGLGASDLSRVEFTGTTGTEVNKEFQPVVRGLGSLKPAVTVGSVDQQGDNGTAVLSYVWAFPGLEQTWTYNTQVQLVREAGRWRTSWQPAIVAPELDGSNRLVQKRIRPDRGELLGEDGAPIMTLRPVVRIGIDKSQVSTAQATRSASRLAKLVKIDAQAYAKRVQKAGPQAFVEAIVFRAKAKDRPANREVFAIPGALPIQSDQMLAPDRDFARALIGTVGDATMEVVEGSQGSVVLGDQVGLSGLQKRYDARMRGTPGIQVQLVAMPAPTNASTTPSPSPTPPSTSTLKPVTLFEVKPVPGQALTTTLNTDLQQTAESVLAPVKKPSALVAIQPSTGAVLAAANGPGAKGQSLATTGRFPPGSTFKMVTALALLRSGMSPGSSVRCPKTVTVDGRKFKNYDDYPAGSLGRITLKTAVAQSCNTAFIGQAKKLNHADLADAAGSLGFGMDYDVGFPSFFGSVPEESNATGEAASLIGQAKVETSPLALAAAVASVSAGETVIPHLIEGQTPEAKAEPLTPREAKQLREMLRAVVSQGSGRVLSSLQPPAVLAKTGTAEYGKGPPYKTHTWMVAAQGDLAVAVFVADGKSGSTTAGPLLRSFLAKAR